MRIITRATLALTGAAALTLFAVVPANAAPTGDNTVTVPVAGSTMDIVTGTAVSPVPVGDAEGFLPGSMNSATYAGISVVDGRATTGAWNVTVTTSAFALVGVTEALTTAQQAQVDSMSTAAISYATAGFAAEDANGAAITEATAIEAQTAIDADGLVVATTPFTGNNSATWAATLNVVVPMNALVGNYATVVTHSVL